jgi:aspartate carbamoyltransferase catalytic subunit
VNFVGSHIISVDQFDRAAADRVFEVADKMQPYAMRQRITRVLQGAILSNMFFEPSTRTRVSFGSAFNLLGGEVRETTEAKSSSLAKGESLYDTARVLSGYSDVIVMRHPESGSVAKFAEASRVPVINGGDGPNEHPSQALLDLYPPRPSRLLSPRASPFTIPPGCFRATAMSSSCAIRNPAASPSLPKPAECR